MAATRPVILAALKAALVTGVTLVSGRVVLPWEVMPDPREVGAVLQIEVADGMVDDSESIGQWLHTIKINIGAVKSGAFDYQATWNILAQVSSAIKTAGTLSGLVQRIDITGAADSIESAGDKILWPHLSAELTYLTASGTI